MSESEKPPAASLHADALALLLGGACPVMLVMAPGHVGLAGAGPGDRGHLTLHALCGLIQADVIVYDALVDSGVLDLAPIGAVREFAGKRGGRPSIHQTDITARLIALARDGKRVLRLKGGDPYVFGRGAEEALGLARAGVAFRVIPGLTSGLAGLAAAQIPATVRGVNQAIVLATGHSAEGEADAIASLDWGSLARLGQPIVLYMAVRTFGEIARRLIEGGMAAATPAAAISQAASESQRLCVATLETLDAVLRAERLPTPALIVIGEIVRLHEALRQG